MKVRSFLLNCSLVLITGIALSQPAPIGEKTAVPGVATLPGVWRAETDGSPAVTLVISDEDGSLHGAILFYFLKREAPDKHYTSIPGLPEPMFNLKFDGESLTFQVSHRRAHPPRTLSDPPVTMRLKLMSANAAGQMQAELTNLSEYSPSAIAVRSDY